MRPPIAQQSSIPVAVYIPQDENSATQLPDASPVVVVDAAALYASSHAPSNVPAKPPRRCGPGSIFLLILLLACLGGGGYIIYYYAIAPGSSSGQTSGSGSNGGFSFTKSPTAPTVPTTQTPTSTRSPTAPTPETYGIEFVYSPTPVPTPIKNIFDQARTKWQSVLVEPGVSPRPPAGSMLCGHSERTYNGVERIDDLEIYVDISAIDGEGEILGYARPCGLIVSNTFRSVTGEMVFDSADLDVMLNDGSLLNVICHEMGHVLGIGSFWDDYGKALVLASNSYRYTGQYGKEGYVNVGGVSGNSPPIELDGGSGTAFSHWDDDTFQNELMTGYIGTGSNPLSKMSVKSLMDLGYIVNANMADAYSIPTPPPNSGRRRFLRSSPINKRPRHGLADRSFFSQRERFPIVEVDAD